MASEQLEEYLEALGRLEERGERITTSSLAKERQVSAPSVTEMLGRLSERGLISYQPRGEITLSDEGRALARSVMRRHRLWERFLHDILGFPWDRVHGEACKLEHATSPEVERELARAVGDTPTCPHGHTIPNPAGEASPVAGMPLSQLPPSEVARVASVREEDPSLLRSLDRIGLKPGVEVEMIDQDHGSNGVTFRIGGHTHSLSAEEADSVNVTPVEPASAAQTVPLARLAPGESAVVKRLTAGKSFVARCLALGFTPGTQVSMVQNPRSGPLIVLVRDTKVAIGRGEAQRILVTRKGDGDGRHD
ncbi:MAG: FeoA domain-containing protein [Sphingomonadaceae bacterium]